MNCTFSPAFFFSRVYRIFLLQKQGFSFFGPNLRTIFLFKNGLFSSKMAYFRWKTIILIENCIISRQKKNVFLPAELDLNPFRHINLATMVFYHICVRRNFSNGCNFGCQIHYHVIPLCRFLFLDVRGRIVHGNKRCLQTVFRFQQYLWFLL